MTIMIMPASGIITGIPGRRCTSGPDSGHNGFDIAKRDGGPILAAASGKVVTVNFQSGGAGHYVNIDHGGGWVTKYFHLANKSPRRVGDRVEQGDEIGSMGTTGGSTGVHLHFEIRRNNTVVRDDKLFDNFPCDNEVTRGETISYTFPGLPSEGSGGGSGPDPSPTLRRGSTGSAVRELQTLLNRYGFSVGAVDGIFGPKTEAAVEDYQKARGLQVDGIVGPKTWATLRKNSPSKESTLRRGSTGSAVRELQTLLNRYGFSVGAVDGIFGPKTEAAVENYQRARGLQVDGIVGPKTWAALRKNNQPR